MTADVTILIGEHKDVVAVPVQCVVVKGRKASAWVKNGDNIERRDLVLGASNDTYIEVKDGLNVGDLVLQRPRAEVAEANADSEEVEAVDVEKTFGASKAAVADGPAGGTGPGGPGGEAGPRGEGGGPGGGRRGGGRPRMPTFAELDKDKDGKVSLEEFPEQMRPFFDRMDTNQDGFMVKEEEKAAAERRKQMEAQGGFGGGGGGGFGGPPQ